MQLMAHTRGRDDECSYPVASSEVMALMRKLLFFFCVCLMMGGGGGGGGTLF